MGEIKLPSHWQFTSLGNVVTLQRGKDLPKTERQAGSYPVVGSNGIVGYHSEFMSTSPGVMVGRSGSVGKVIWIECKHWALNTSLYVKNFYGNDPLFISYFLDYLNLAKYASGVSVPTLNRNIVHQLAVAIPPLPEQKTIAHTLQTIHKAKETHQRELELERERKAALMQYLFTHGTRNEPRKHNKIGEIPESWGIVPFKNITVSGTQNGIYKSKEFYGRGYEIADMKDIFKGEILEIGNMDKLDLDDEELAKFRLCEGDLIFARRSFKPEGAGKCQFIPKLNEPVVFSSSIIRVSLNKEIAEPRFYAYFFNSEIGNQLIRQITRILAVSGISGSDLKNLSVPILTQKEQKEIVGTLESCDRKIQALEKEIALTDELFHAMLEQLMTGKISTQPLTVTYV